MVKAQKMKCVLGYFLVVVAILVLSFGMFKTSSALTEQQLDEFAQNNILFYEPNASSSLCEGAGYNEELTWADLNSLGSGYDTMGERLREIVKTYGGFAMNLQRYYGVPWEMIFGIMVQESAVGTDTFASDADPNTWNPNKKAKEAGMFEMMGLVEGDKWFNSDVDTGLEMKDNYAASIQSLSVCSEGGVCGLEPGTPGVQAHSFKNYPTISRMMLGYVVYHVRSGKSDNYKKGLELLTPSNYSENLRQAVGLIMSPYCVSESGDCYSDSLYNTIIGTSEMGKIIKEVATEKGWLSSAELARKENLPAGGHATEDWGWGDIRLKAWEAYGVLGLPESTAAQLGSSSSSGCGTRYYGNCSLDLFEGGKEDGGCTEDNFVYFYQRAKTWGSLPYSGGTLGTDACGPTAASMVITALTGQFVTPPMIVDLGREKNLGFELLPSGGTYGVKMLDIYQQFNLSYTLPDRSEFNVEHMEESIKYVNDLLDQGKMAIFSLNGTTIRYYCDSDKQQWTCCEYGNKNWASCSKPEYVDRCHCDSVRCECNWPLGGAGGHYVAIRGRADDGNWLIFNSSDGPLNDNRYDPRTLLQAYFSHSGRNGYNFTVVSR